MSNGQGFFASVEGFCNSVTVAYRSSFKTAADGEIYLQ